MKTVRLKALMADPAKGLNIRLYAGARPELERGVATIRVSADSIAKAKITRFYTPIVHITIAGETLGLEVNAALLQRLKKLSGDEFVTIGPEPGTSRINFLD